MVLKELMMSEANTTRASHDVSQIRNSDPTRSETTAQPTLGPWTGFKPVRLETPWTPKHAWFHCTTATFDIPENVSTKILKVRLGLAFKIKSQTNFHRLT
ncbi:hypothetical protein E2C01_020713 [Portunus trituberculatus]|uniref:Uncharacterized protein n=1 Tax=Portunus trituberculatus TaxID=210409 RepID=A0A5B7E0N1_PORTR|nr:hypothetical protein [Portunus trituberculatus]